MEDGSLVAHVLLHVLYCDKTVSVTMADEEFDGDLEGSVSSSWCGLLLPRLARCPMLFMIVAVSVSHHTRMSSTCTRTCLSAVLCGLQRSMRVWRGLGAPPDGMVELMRFRCLVACN